MHQSLSCSHESILPLKGMELNRAQSLDGSCSWAADGLTKSSQYSDSSSHQELSADVSMLPDQQPSHLSPFTSTSNKPSSPPQPTIDAPTSCASHHTKLILRKLTSYSAQLKAAQSSVLQRVPWGSPIHSSPRQPNDSLDPHNPVRRSKRTRGQEMKPLELCYSKGTKEIWAAQGEVEDSVDEFMEAACSSPHPLQQTASRTTTDPVVPLPGSAKRLKEDMLHTIAGKLQCCVLWCVKHKPIIVQ